MEAKSRAPGPVVIGQDDQTELHVQAILQSGRRELDIRMWRRGPAGFAPSRSALTVEADDLAVLIEGIDRLLAESDGATRVARVILDRDDSRRLRAETEPFGVHFTARLGFWQRIRDSWRAVGDGLQLAAEQLVPLRQTLTTLAPHLVTLTESQGDGHEAGFDAPGAYRWPSPGRDWLTVEGNQLAFHPRGVRITARLSDDEEAPDLELQQWRHEDRLWLSRDLSCRIDIAGIQALLGWIRRLADYRGDEPGEPIELGHLQNDLTVCFTTSRELQILATGEEETGEVVSVPFEFVRHFGRLLVEAGNLLLVRMPAHEREELLTREDVAVSEEIVSEALLTPDNEEQIKAAAEELARRPVFTTAEELVAQILRGEEEQLHPQVQGELELPEEPEEDVRRLAPLGEVRLGRHSVYLYDMREDQRRFISLQFDGKSLNVPIGNVQTVVEDLRQMYYQALRGRRGQAASIGNFPVIQVSVHHQGSSTQVLLESDDRGEKTSILFPVSDVPAFLNATETALARSAREPHLDTRTESA